MTWRVNACQKAFFIGGVQSSNDEQSNLWQFGPNKPSNCLVIVTDRRALSDLITLHIAQTPKPSFHPRNASTSAQSLTRFMFSRLSRYMTGSKRRKPKYKPVPEFPPKITLNLSSSSRNRATSASSGHSSSCSIQPEHAPSFLQVVCNDSRPVYCMETVPFYNPSSLPPGTRKENSLYESAHDEILRERMKVTAVENVAEQDRQRVEGEDGLMVGVLNRESLRRKARVNSQRFSSLRASDLKQEDKQRCNSLQHSMEERRYGRQSFDYREREGEAIQYPSMDSYFGPPIYRDPSLSRQSFRLQRSQSSQRTLYHDARYLEPEVASLHESFPFPPKILRPNPPVHPGPFRPRPPPKGQEQFPLPPQPHPRVVAADHFIRVSSLRQGPYRDFQYPQSSLSELNYNPYSHHPEMRSCRDNVPVTKVTRLKQARAFKREDGMVSDIGIGLGRISGMAASRSVSRRTQSDVGARVRTPSKPQPKVSALLFLSSEFRRHIEI